MSRVEKSSEIVKRACSFIRYLRVSGPFKFFFDIINVRVTFLDVNGPIK